MIDTHCHLYLDQFDNDRDFVIKQAVQTGVIKMLAPGIDLQTCILACKLSRKYAGVVYSAVGIHPNYSSNYDSDAFEKMLVDNSNQIVAIGEIGLDYFRNFASKESQIFTFEKMLKLADKKKLPICLHNRESENDLLAILSNWYSTADANSKPGGVFHAFDGSEKIAEWAIDHGFLVGIGGMITYKKNDYLRKTVKEIGIEKVIIETDAPYLTPEPLRGRRNTPSNLNLVVSSLASIFNKTNEEISSITDYNAMRIFGF